MALCLHAFRQPLGFDQLVIVSRTILIAAIGMDDRGLGKPAATYRHEAHHTPMAVSFGGASTCEEKSINAARYSQPSSTSRHRWYCWSIGKEGRGILKISRSIRNCRFSDSIDLDPLLLDNATPVTGKSHRLMHVQFVSNARLTCDSRLESVQPQYNCRSAPSH